MTAPQPQANALPGTQAPATPPTIHRKIGSTNYTANIHFSKTGKETLEEKILKLIRREASLNA